MKYSPHPYRRPLKAGLLVALFLLPLSVTADERAQQIENVSAALTEVRREGWKIAGAIVDTKLARLDRATFPAIADFVDDFRAIDARIEKGDQWPTESISGLVESGCFWRAGYSVAPGDPAWTVVHGCLLLAAGEAQRSQYVALLGRQGLVPPDFWDTATMQVAVLAGRIMAPNEVLVEQGIELHDRQEYAKAIAVYAEALQAWPQSGRTWYELGQTKMISQLSPDHDDSETEGTGAKGDSPILTELSDAEAYRRARHHDPFLWQAYQGKAEQVELLRVVVGVIVPTWQRFQSDPRLRLADEDLAAFAEGCQRAGVHDLALVTRQAVIARRGSYAPEDHPFISTSLRAHAPGKQTEAALATLAGERVTAAALVRPASPP